MVLDNSNSMAYAGEGRRSKLEVAKTIAATFLYLVQKQRDAGAFVSFGKTVNDFLPPASSGAHFKNALTTLAGLEPDGETDLGTIFDEIADRLTSRSLVVILSDLLDPNEESMLSGIHRMSHRGHDVVLVQVLDQDELTFPFDRMTRFEGLEIDDRLLADPKALRDAYMAELEAFQMKVKSACLGGRLDYVVVDTSKPLDVTLSSYLAQRAGTR